MENSALFIYKAIGAVQGIIANAATLDEALREGLEAIVEHSGAEGDELAAVINSNKGVLNLNGKRI